jgi:hypothetical protein
MRNLLFVLLLFPIGLFSQKAGTLTVNVSASGFIASGSSYDYEGTVIEIGSGEYSIDDIAIGDILVDRIDNEYRIDSIEVVITGAELSIWVTCLEQNCFRPQSGRA